MKIAFNTYFLRGRKAGIGYYSSNILKYLLEILPKGDECVEIDNPFNLNKLIFEQIYLFFKLIKIKPDIYFSPSIILPFLSNIPSVLVVHDLVFKLFPKFYRGGINILYLNVFFPSSLRKAKKIITVSENTKKDLIKLYDIPEEKIEVIYLAASQVFVEIKNKEKLRKTKEKYSLPDKFILFIGTIEPRKNIRGLIEAYFNLPRKLQLEYKLVLCGQKGWGYRGLQDWISKHPQRSSVVFLDYVNEVDLLSIYNLADLFVYPSFYEGFGLPVLEAMSCGTPVITSNISSMPEIAGDAAILIDPYNIKELSQAIDFVLTDEKIALNMSKKGLDRAKVFLWEKAAKMTYNVILDII